MRKSALIQADCYVAKGWQRIIDLVLKYEKYLLKFWLRNEFFLRLIIQYIV